jgi:hypothetical protein
MPQGFSQVSGVSGGKTVLPGGCGSYAGCIGQAHLFGRGHHFRRQYLLGLLM